jgi:hypothetical protein
MAITQEELQVKIEKAKRAGWDDTRIQNVVQSLQSRGQIEQRGFLQNLGKAITDPIRDFGGLTLEAGRQALGGTQRGQMDRLQDEVARGTKAYINLRNSGRTEEAEQLRKMVEEKNEQLSRVSKGVEALGTPKFMTSPKQQFAFENISGDIGQGALYGTRKGVGAASYLIPGGGGTAATALGRVGTAFGRGAIASGMRTFGEDFTDVGDVALGSVIGGGFGAAIQGGGELIRGARGGFAGAADRASRASKELSNTAKLKGLKATKGNLKSFGGTQFFDDMDEVGIRYTNFDDFVDDANAAVSKGSSQLDDAITQHGNIRVPKQAMKAAVKREMNKHGSKAVKADYQKVLDAIDDDLGRGKTATLKNFLKTRRDYGARADWRPSLDITQDQAKAYRVAYTSMNKTLDRSFSKAGFTSFREANNIVSKGINAMRLAEKVAPKHGYADGLGLLDAITLSAGGFGPEGIAFTAAQRYARSPQGMGIAARGLGKAGDVAKGISQRIPTTAAAGVGFGQALQTPLSQVGQIAPQLGRGAISATAAGVAAQPGGPTEGLETRGFTGGGADYLNQSFTPAGNNQALVQGGLLPQDRGRVGGGGYSVDDLVSEISGKKTKPLTKEQGNAASGLRALGVLSQTLSSGGGGIERGALFAQNLPFQGFSSQAQLMKTSANEVQDVLQRMRTGAAINETEYEFYKNQLPKFTDKPETIAYKLQIFQQLFSSLAAQGY